MNPPWIKHALEWLKTPANYFVPLLAVSFFGLFAPLDLMEFLGIQGWLQEGKAYLGSALVISLAFVGWHYLSAVVHWVVDKYRVALSRWAAHARLKSLSAEEKQFLSGYLKENSRIQYHWRNNTIAAVLLSERILYVAVEQGNVDRFPFTIFPWVWDYLHKHPHLVGVIIINGAVVSKHVAKS